MTRMILVRHGQTEWNRVERFRGRADVPLNDVGLAQAELTGRRIAAEWQPAAVYASPLSRAVQTAEAIARQVALTVQVRPGLADIDFGAWQGLTPDEARAGWPAMAQAWFETPHTALVPGGETLAELRQRAMATVNELAAKHVDQTIVLVGHTVINRVILLGVLALGNERFWRIAQDNCAINVFDIDRGECYVVSLNDTCHLRRSPSEQAPAP